MRLLFGDLKQDENGEYSPRRLSGGLASWLAINGDHQSGRHFAPGLLLPAGSAVP